MESNHDMQNKTRPVFFVSNNTGITVETLGRSLLFQFSNLVFESHSLRFIDTAEKAQQAKEQINQVAKEQGIRPIVLGTLVDPDLRKILASSNSLYLDVFERFIGKIEDELGHDALPGEGRTHGIVDEDYYADRINAVNFTLKTDDGIGAVHYEQADIILTGASRTSKTPTSLYLALHYGLRTANYPIVDDELDLVRLPRVLRQYRHKLFGLIITPERLQNIRQKRRPDSQYASLSQCQYEIRQTEAMFLQDKIKYFDVTNMSIEEVSSMVMSALELSPRTFMP